MKVDKKDFDVSTMERNFNERKTETKNNEENHDKHQEK